jgi:hypothetical protein
MSAPESAGSAFRTFSLRADRVEGRLRKTIRACVEEALIALISAAIRPLKGVLRDRCGPSSYRTG